MALSNSKLIDGGVLFHLWLVEAAARYRFTFATERELQEQIEQVLRLGRYDYIREWQLSPESRPDLMVRVCKKSCSVSELGLGGFQPFGTPAETINIAIEVKLGAPTTEDIRQLKRYAGHDLVHQIVCICTRRGELPHALGPSLKRVHQVVVGFHRL